MSFKRLQISRIEIPFQQAFKHSSAERSETESILIAAHDSDGLVGYGESCPRSYVSGEDLLTAHEFFDCYHESLPKQIDDLDSLTAWVRSHSKEIDANPSAWCAVELALLDLLAKQNDVSVEELLGLRTLSGSFRYSAVIGDGTIGAFCSTFNRYAAIGMTDFKIKLSGQVDHDREKLDFVRQQEDSGFRIRLDANNLWSSAEDAASYLHQLDYPVFAFEEPLQPNQYEELGKFVTITGVPVILDESFLRIEQLDHLDADPDRFMINLRVSKMGGLIRSLRIVDEARARRIKLIVGAQVGETSLLTRAGLTVAHESQGMLVGQEGAFGTLLLQHDLWEPPLVFEAGGKLDTSGISSQGFGLRLSDNSHCIQPIS